MSKNPEVIFPIKKRINTELCVERRAGFIYKNGSPTFWLN